MESLLQNPTFSALEARFDAAVLSVDDRLSIIDLEIQRAAETLAALQLLSATTKMAKNRKESRIFSLPPEIVIQIFRWASLEKCLWDRLLPYARTYSRLSNLTSIASVCREWRSICRSSAALWSEIDWQMGDIKLDRIRSDNRHPGRCISFSGSSHPISLTSGPSGGEIELQGWEALRCLAELHGTKVTRLELDVFQDELFLKKFVNLPNLRSLTLRRIPWYLFCLPSASKLYHHLETVEVLDIIRTCRLGRHWGPSDSTSDELGPEQYFWAPSRSFIAQHDLEYRSSAQIQKVLIACPELEVTILFILPISHTLVHLHLGQMTPIDIPPRLGDVQGSLVNQARSVKEILLPCLLTLHFKVPDDRKSLGFFETLRCPTLRRVRCYSSMHFIGRNYLVEPDCVRDTIRWAIRSFSPPTDANFSLGHSRDHYPPSTPRLLILDVKHLQEDVTDAIHSVVSSSPEPLTIVTCVEHDPAVDPPPALDLDMESSWLPGPGDPFWDRHIQSIITLPGPRTDDASEGRTFEGIPNRWRWFRCRSSWDKVVEAGRLSSSVQ